MQIPTTIIGATTYPGYTPVSGTYYASGQTQSGSGGTLNQTEYSQFVVYVRTSFDRIGVYCTGATATAVTRLGIYNDSGGIPTTLILDAGTVDCSTTGAKETTISQQLNPGLYWLAACPQIAVAATAYALAPNGGVLVRAATNLQNAAQFGGQWKEASITGAFANASNLAVDNQSIVVVLRAA